MKPGSIQAKVFIERLASDMEHQPEWRTESAMCEAYYDTLQLPADVKAFMEARNQPVIVNNLIQPTINGILGMEAKTRTDYQVRGDDDEGVELAEALNERLNEEVRLSRVHRANSDAFKRQVIGGLGWVEVRRNHDPFGTDYITEEVDWREVHYDWRSTRPDLQDARYVARERWIDVDMAKAYFPKHIELIEAAVNGDSFAPMYNAMLASNVMPDLVGPYTTELQSQFDKFGGIYVNQERHQVKILQAQYRVPRRGHVLKFGPNKMEFDQHNKVHMALYQSGRAKVFPATFSTIRHAWFIGPHLVGDAPSPYPHNQFNLVPFWGFREGGTRKPYGLVRNLMSAQDEVNFRRAMLTWNLTAKLVVKESDATIESDEDVKAMVNAGDGVINLNPERKSARHSEKGFSLVTETGLASQQFQVMQDAMKQIQDLAGVYSSFLGQNGGATSGIAINSLVEQATVTLSDLFDNYQFGRQQVGELLMAMIEEDIGEEETEVKIYVNEARPTKRVVLNKREEDEQGQVTITNRLQQLKKHVLLADVQSSPGYRAQQLQQLMELAATLPDQAKLVILEDIISLTELPKKNEIINKVKQAIGLGVDIESMSEEQKAAYQQRQEQQKQEVMLALRERVAKVAKEEAEAKKKDAEAEHTKRQTETLDANERLDEARAAEILASIEEKELNTTLQRNGAADLLDEKVDALLANL